MAELRSVPGDQWNASESNQIFSLPDLHRRESFSSSERPWHLFRKGIIVGAQQQRPAFKCCIVLGPKSLLNGSAFFSFKIKFINSPVSMACAHESKWDEEDARHFVESCFKCCNRPKNGKVYVMYHGTHVNHVDTILKYGFKQSPDGMLGRGVYVSRDIRKACRYPLNTPESQKVVLKLRVNVGKVKTINCQGHPLQKTWHDHGYDTAWCPPNCGMVPSDLEVDCIWDPKRIKVVGIIDQSAQPNPWYFPNCY
ncbi:uncharacterized protein LOC125482645 isoform X1 [Rhincodon typus]|uniref:uncharacterized protein LOC125482645 isoform X1 n=1 Tax=Rhincodon typus TaxID=259920 RepID=UPI00202F1F06|nr:uncharacterized protein LOC125482645 isoform X1 [Rhincodon typus]